MNTKSEFELIVSEGKRHPFERMLAALSFTVIFYGMFAMVARLVQNGITDELIRSCAGFMEIIGLGLALGLRFAVTKTILIDTDTDKLISRYHLGPISYDDIYPVPKLEYVAVFKNQKQVYEVNLWYKGNKHYGMYGFDEKAPAFKFAESVAEKLNLDLLDKSEHGVSTWIERTAT
jgi:hypothetical protein